MVEVLDLDLLQQLDVVDVERRLAKEEPAVDLLVLLHLELVVVLVDVLGQVSLLAQEWVGAKRKGGLVVRQLFFLPLPETLGDPPV